MRGAFYRLARLLGLFTLASWLYRGRQSILCYHAFAFEDEHLFRPQLFMQPATFARRLDLLARRGYRVITLDEALRRLDAGSARLRDVVITIDDGFISVLRHAAPALAARRIPAMLYLTTHYQTAARPVADLVAQYLIWRALRRYPERADALAALLPPGEGGPIARYQRLDKPARRAFLRNARAAGVLEPESAGLDERFRIVTAEQVRALQAAGLSIELHTHRHRYPADPAQLRREIDDNRAALAACGVAAARHLCYPSGEWRTASFPVLEAAGVVSATTCIAGLNERTTPRLALHRFLDADDISDIEFEAEISGFKELLRGARRRLRGA
ncbi:MAG TPA: polysaccharide deacetylase family protein [Rhodocyclaceae bacterium]|nr:polysaccharide deacetylase family protein [Rhodocyclaceae bacterium]